MVNSSTGRLI